MIEIYLLEQLDAFARCGTLSKAAEELHITQPALTRSMKKLEEVVGVSLFFREGRKLSLTETGKTAARYARRILDDEREMTEQIAATDRSLRSIVLGSCAPMPVIRLTPVLQMDFPEKTIITEIQTEDETLIRGLKNHTVQMAVLHAQPDDPGIFCQRYLRESICLYVPEGHPLAGKASVSLEELKDYRILMFRHVGFWKRICEQVIPASDLLIQDSMDAMDELSDSSTIAMFNSDVMMKEGYVSGGRKAIPISDPEMHTIYYVACLDSEKERYRSVFSTVRDESMREFSI
ncbi:MAG: LysR family transcriptional regulator [Eubacteriales bacterium]|jgi:DNA-binding transcriptional LysR family regulator